MKRTEVAALAIVGIVVMSCGLFFCLNPFRIPETYRDHGTLDAFGEWGQQRGVQRGERIDGFLTVTGGDEQVWFTIEDPNGVLIVNVGVNRKIEFALMAEYEGTYVFDVKTTPGSGKTVSLTESMIVPALGLEFWLLVVGAGAFTLGLGLIGYFSEKLVQRRQTKTSGIPPPPPPPL